LVARDSQTPQFKGPYKSPDVTKVSRTRKHSVIFAALSKQITANPRNRNPNKATKSSEYRAIHLLDSHQKTLAVICDTMRIASATVKVVREVISIFLDVNRHATGTTEKYMHKN
jgi:hypothetical protein